MDYHGVTFVVGIPASGKTTFGCQHAKFVIDLRVFARELTNATPFPLLETALGWNEEYENGVYMIDQKEEKREREQKKVSVVFLDNLDVLDGEIFQLYVRAGLRRWRHTHFIIACREGYFADEREMIYYTAPIFDGHTRREELFHIHRVSYNGETTGDIESALCAEAIRFGDESLREEVGPAIDLLKKLALGDIERSPGVLALMQEVHGGKYDGICDEGVDTTFSMTMKGKVEMDDNAPPTAPLPPVELWAVPLFASASAGVKKLIKAVLVPVEVYGYRFAYASQRARLAAECIFDNPSKYLDKIWLRGMRALLRQAQDIVSRVPTHAPNLLEVVRDTASNVNTSSQTAGANAVTILAGVDFEASVNTSDKPKKLRFDNDGSEKKCLDLRGAILTNIHIRGADLSGSTFLRGSNLRGADLRDCDLRAANMEETGLRGADLRGVRWGEKCPLKVSRSVLSLILSADGKWLYSGSMDGAIRVWSVGPSGSTPFGQCVRTMKGHTDWVMALALSADGKWLYSGSWDNTIRVWSVGEPKFPLATTLGSRSDLPDHLSADAPYGTTGLEAGHKTGQCVRIMEGHNAEVNTLAVSADGKWLYSGSSDNTIRVWSVGLSGSTPSGHLSTGQTLRVMEGHTFWVTSLALSPDGKWLYSGSDDNTIRVWSVGPSGFTPSGHFSTDQSVRVIEGHTWSVTALALSADGKWLYSGSSFPEKTIRVWDLSTGQCVRTMEGHTHSVSALALSADGNWLYSVSWDNTIRVWSVGTTPSGHLSTGQCVRTMEGHTDWVKALALSADGKWLYSGSHDNTIRVWDVSCPISINCAGNMLSAENVRVDEHTLFSDDGLEVLKEAASK